MNANSAATKKKKSAAAKKKATTTAAAEVPTSSTTTTVVSPVTATTAATTVPLSPSSAPIDLVYTATADKAEENVQYYQEEEVNKYLSSHPLEMTSLASTMSLGELSHTSTGPPPNVPTVVHAQPPVSSLLSVMISTLFVVIISVVGDGSSNITHNSTDCSDCNVVSVETWPILERPKRVVLQMISTTLNACESVGVEEALTDKISNLVHHLVDHVFALPVHASAYVGALHHVVSTMTYLTNLWWSWTTWWACLPFNMTMYAIRITRSVVVYLLVLFLNHAPGGHRVLRALNGHLHQH